MRMKYRLLSVAACLALLHGAASAQETGGLLGTDRPRYGLVPAVMNVPSPEALRDSLAFAANVKSFVPRAPGCHGGAWWTAWQCLR